jgi:hypothetical protein
MFLAAASVGFSQTTAIIEPKPHVAISVYDYAHVSTGLLTAAEEDAQRVFRQAGVETIWAAGSCPLIGMAKNCEEFLKQQCFSLRANLG